MPERNLYVVLGVSPGESAAGIRAAYLEQAKRHHRDVAAGEGPGPFQEIAEAYRNLADPELRRRHDERLHVREATHRGAPPPARRRRAPIRPEPLRVMSDPAAVHPSFEAVHERLLRNFTRLGVPKAERVEPLAFDLVLTPDEAARGGLLPIAVPVFLRCPSCQGSGDDWGFGCLRCDGQGVVEGERTLGVPIPPLVSGEAVLEVPLAGLGVHNFVLQLRVRIGQ